MQTKCDLCLEDCDALDTKQLLKHYQTNGVVDICPACNKWANETLNSLRSQIAPDMRELIRNRIGVRPSLFTRLFS